MLAGLGAGVVVSLLTAAEHEAQLDRFSPDNQHADRPGPELRQFDEAEALSKERASMPPKRDERTWFPNS